nr:MAG TPA: hypothetical protein [Caudoviricetes sp.]
MGIYDSFLSLENSTFLLRRKIIKKKRDTRLKSIKKLIACINKLKIAIRKFGSLRESY